jgi:hypothetical protein
VTLGEFEHAAEMLSRQTTVQGLLAAKACSISRVVGDLLIGIEEHVRKPRPPLELAHEYLISDFPLTQEVVEASAPRYLSLLDEQPEPTEAALLGQLGFDSVLMV